MRTAHETVDAVKGGIRTASVWDPLVRIIHWTVLAGVVANGFLNDAEGDVHSYIGYGILGMVALRLLWGLIGSNQARFRSFPPSPVAAVEHVRSIMKGEKRVHLSHNPLGALMVYNIWATLLVLSATGIMMGTVRFFGIAWVEEVHEAAFVWLMISVGLHIAGVIGDTWWTGIPLVRAMIDGKKRIPDERTMT